MAEAIFNGMLDEFPRLRQLGFKAQSAGTFAMLDSPISETANEALKLIGIENGYRHKSRSFSQDLAENAVLILAMQEMMLEEVVALAPEAESRVHMLKGYANHVDGMVGSEEYDIVDPYREPLDTYIDCAREIKDCVTRLMQRLEKEWPDA